MADETTGPITFRAKSAQARALLEAVARHRGVSLSKLVAEVTDDFARQYLAKIGPERFSADLKADAEERERALARQMDELVRHAGVASMASIEDNEHPNTAA